MTRIRTYNEIDRAEWSRLVRDSATGTWFQTPEAYEFFASMPDLFRPFAIAVERVNETIVRDEARKELTNERALRAVCVGYVTQEKSAIRQYFTRRAILLGGPALADDCTDEEVTALLEVVKTKTRHLQSQKSDLPETTHQSACMQAYRQSEDLSSIAVEQQDASQKHATLTKNTKNIFYRYEPIYIETRNFNDYSRWKEAFEQSGFRYQPHLNFHVDCTDKEAMWERLSENRRRQIRKMSASNACSMSREQGSLNEPLSRNDEVTEQDVREWYAILAELYRTKVKTPLWPVEFFLEAYRQGVGTFMLVKHEGKVIGGSMVVELTNEGRGCVYEWFECGMNGEYKEQYPSVTATWKGMVYANEQGCARYDLMGAGMPDVPYGVRDFKAEFGGKMVEQGRFLCICHPVLYRIGEIGVRWMRRFGG